MASDEFITRYLTLNNEGDSTFNRCPCPFLPGTRCRVYEYRPDACRSYPHLQKKDFVSRLVQAVSNCSVCPISFNVIDTRLDKLIKDASPINHLTADDPPVFLIHYEKSNKPGNIHHPNFGAHLKTAMDALGIECIRRMDSDYHSMNDAYKDMVQFVIRHFKGD